MIGLYARSCACCVGRISPGAASLAQASTSPRSMANGAAPAACAPSTLVRSSPGGSRCRHRSSISKRRASGLHGRRPKPSSYAGVLAWRTKRKSTVRLPRCCGLAPWRIKTERWPGTGGLSQARVRGMIGSLQAASRLEPCTDARSRRSRQPLGRSLRALVGMVRSVHLKSEVSNARSYLEALSRDRFCVRRGARHRRVWPGLSDWLCRIASGFLKPRRENSY